MARDHYVAQTYLKHWCNPAGMMVRYPKNPAGDPFPCAPVSVCREWDGDLNPYFQKNPNLLGEYRKIFEPGWNPMIESLRSGRITTDDHFVIAGYWAQLTTCTPTWRKHAMSIYKQQIEESIPVVAEHLARQKPHMANYIRRMIFKEKIRPSVDPQYVKHILTSQLAATTVAFYQQDWIVIRNDSDLPFITSDNPSSIFPDRPFNVPVSRFLPLAPDLGILCVGAVKEWIKVENFDLNTKPGIIQVASPDRSKIEEFNRVVAMNADRFIFARDRDAWVQALLDEHREHGLYLDIMRMPCPDGYYTGVVLRVGKKRMPYRK